MDKKLKSYLYIVPTPIGNLEDISIRAIFILKYVDIIVAESFLHTKKLLDRFQIKKKVLVINNYNENIKYNLIIKELKKGKKIALVSNAGTPLINDPGYNIVYKCHELGIKVIPLPGPCAAITALSASGLSSNHFCYEGYLPKKKNERIKKLNILKYETRTIIFYESTHRIIKSMEDICKIFGNNRNVVIAREITKLCESIKKLPIMKLIEWIKAKKNRTKGEIVLIIEGYKKITDNIINNKKNNFEKIFLKLKKYMTLKEISKFIAEIYGLNKNKIYKIILSYKNNKVS